ncbi:MAG: T9SS type A sorting domain-containing protein [Flavipsychrobacter sp.]
MKKLSIFILSLAVGGNLYAQVPDMGNGNQPVKLQDVVDEYMKQHNNAGEVKIIDGKYVEETGDYHFNRWLWYQSHNTDENGYIVSPLKKMKEWTKFKANRQNLKTTASQANWTFRGPTSSPGGYNGIGRVNCIEFHPSNVNTYWVGTGGGGVWKTVNDGVNWTSVTDDLPVLGVSDIDVNPMNPNTIYLCTGDRDASDTYSIGVLKSTDGGLTWDTTGLQWQTSQNRLTNCLVINRLDTNSLTLAASNGIYKSYDGGKNWSFVQTSGHFKQLVYHPIDTNIIYAARSGNNSGHVYRSTDGGATWSLELSGNNKRRAAIAVTPDRPNIVKVVICNNSNGLEGIYHSSNSGASFTRIYQASSGSNCNGNLLTGTLSGNSCGGQGWYDLCIAISPADSNEVYVGGVNTWHSNNGGTSWSLTNQWYYTSSGSINVHADKHWLAFHPLNSNRLFECNDGGVYKTDNPQSKLWTDITNGMGITQFYRNAVSDVASFQIAGAQDNGTKGRDASGAWDELTGGDGMNCEMDYADSNTFYTAIQNGELRRTTNRGNNFTDIQNNIPGRPKGAWITPYVISPHNNQHLIAGYEQIWFSSNRGTSWTEVTPTNVTGTRDARRLAMTADSSGTIYALYENSGIVYYTHGFVPGDTISLDTIQVPYGGTISDIKADQKKYNHFWITFSGYNNTKVAEYDNGVWTNRSSGLPNVPIYCFEADSSLDITYVGTAVGVFYIDSASNNKWEPFTGGMPSIEVADLGINYTTKEIWAATYGRGLWSSPKQFYQADTTKPVDTTLGLSVIPYVDDAFEIAPNPNQGKFILVASKAALRNEQVHIRILDYTGRAVWVDNKMLGSNGVVELEVKDVPAGVYIVELSNSKAVIGRKRVVIQ